MNKNKKETAPKPKVQEQPVVLVPACTIKFTTQQYEELKKNLEFDLRRLQIRGI